MAGSRKSSAKLAQAMFLIGALPPSAFGATNTRLAMLETPLETLQASLQGPVALAIGIIAMVLTGAMLIFGGELSDFARRSCYVVLVRGVLLPASTIVGVLFTNTSAIIFDAQ